MNSIIIDNYSYFDSESFLILSDDNSFEEAVKNIVINKNIERIFINVNIKFSDRKRKVNSGVELWRKGILNNNLFSKDIKYVFYSFLSKEQSVHNSYGRDVVLLYDDLVEYVRIPENIENIRNNIANNINSEKHQITYSSEALLSGWGMYVFESKFKNTNSVSTKANYEKYKIDIDNKNVLLLDDYTEEWKIIFEKILSKPLKYVQVGNTVNIDLLKDVKKVSSGQNSDEHINKLFKDIKLRKYNLVLLDLFYNPLGEYHEKDKRIDDENLKKLFSYKLLKYFSNNYPYIPVIMFTSSTKVWNYKHFFKSGASDWWTKYGDNIKWEEQAVKDYFDEFKFILNRYLNEPYIKFKTVHQCIEDTREKLNILRNNIKIQSGIVSLEINISTEDKKKIEVLLKKSFDFMKFIDKSDSPFYTSSAIVEQLGNVMEIIYKGWQKEEVKNHINMYFEALLYLRNHASHIGYLEFDIYDVMLSFMLINHGIENILDGTKLNKYLLFNEDTPKIIWEHNLYFIYKSIYLSINDKEIQSICKLKEMYFDEELIKNDIQNDTESVFYIENRITFLSSKTKKAFLNSLIQNKTLNM